MSPAMFDPEALRRARQQAGLTQADLARRLGLAGGERVSEWERGVTVPSSPARLRAIARALGIPITALTVAAAPETASATALMRLRVHAGLSREDLAAKTHVSVTTVERWENGDYVRLPSAETIRLLAKALRRPIREVRAILAEAARPPAIRRRKPSHTEGHQSPGPTGAV